MCAGKPVLLYADGTTGLYFKNVAKSWVFRVQAEAARVHSTDDAWFEGITDTNEDDHPGYLKYQQETGAVTYLASKATKQRFYLLAKYTGNVKFVKLNHRGNDDEVKTLQADGTYIVSGSSVMGRRSRGMV